MAGEKTPQSLDELNLSVDRLTRDFDSLASEIAAEPAPDGDQAASAARFALADSVLPLSAKDGVDSPQQAYLEGLRRRRHRLQREGDVLAAQLAHLSAEAARLRRARADLNAHIASIRQHGAAALTRLDDVHAHRQRTIAWAAASAAQRERLLSWGERLAVHTRRLRDLPPPRDLGWAEDALPPA
jgi:hypothetical protein